MGRERKHLITCVILGREGWEEADCIFRFFPRFYFLFLFYINFSFVVLVSYVLFLALLNVSRRCLEIESLELKAWAIYEECFNGRSDPRVRFYTPGIAQSEKR